LGTYIIHVIVALKSSPYAFKPGDSVQHGIHCKYLSTPSFTDMLCGRTRFWNLLSVWDM